MGIYDRDYYHSGPRVRFASPLGPEWRTSAVFWIIAINVGVFFLQVILKPSGADGILYCSPERVVNGFQVWRLLTAAFCHETSGLWHLFFNMLIVFFFGPQIERLYGRRDFVAFYLTVAVVGNLAFVASAYLTGGSTTTPVLGASGCCMALIVLCALYFPHQMVIVFFIPVPLWLLGTFLVLNDLFGFLRAERGDQIAYVVHLAGAAMGALYRYVDLRLSTLRRSFDRFTLERKARRRFRGGGRSRPADGVPRFLEDLENQRLDRILEKIHRFGRESLTEEEVEFLNRMSDRLRRRP